MPRRERRVDGARRSSRTVTRQGGVFTREQALELSPQPRSGPGSGAATWRRTPWRGRLCGRPSCRTTVPTLVRAASLWLGGDLVACHSTAARACGASTCGEPDAARRSRCTSSARRTWTTDALRRPAGPPARIPRYGRRRAAHRASGAPRRPGRPATSAGSARRSTGWRPSTPRSGSGPCTPGPVAGGAVNQRGLARRGPARPPDPASPTAAAESPMESTDALAVHRRRTAGPDLQIEVRRRRGDGTASTRAGSEDRLGGGVRRPRGAHDARSNSPPTGIGTTGSPSTTGGCCTSPRSTSTDAGSRWWPRSGAIWTAAHRTIMAP